MLLAIRGHGLISAYFPKLEGGYFRNWRGFTSEIGLIKEYFAVGGQVQHAILGIVILGVLNYQAAQVWIARGGSTEDLIFSPTFFKAFPIPFVGLRETGLRTGNSITINNNFGITPYNLA